MPLVITDDDDDKHVKHVLSELFIICFHCKRSTENKSPPNQAEIASSIHGGGKSPETEHCNNH